MGTTVVGFGIGVVATVGAAAAIVTGCANRVAASFGGDDEFDDVAEPDALAHLS